MAVAGDRGDRAPCPSMSQARRRPERSVPALTRPATWRVPVRQAPAPRSPRTRCQLKGKRIPRQPVSPARKRTSAECAFSPAQCAPSPLDIFSRKLLSIFVNFELLYFANRRSK